ncbi:hypothetical protein [Streptomyces neyagawaensis]|uniref:hypothetical protein n=1 Tax=Streptomyces neyagawaensis TaxID=42238 RepID=UPI00355738CE
MRHCSPRRSPAGSSRSTLGAVPPERETRLGRARALRARGRLDPAREACGALLREAAERGDSYGRGLAEYECGHVLRALGGDGAALRHWRGVPTALEGTDAPVLHELRSLTREFSPDGPFGTTVRRPLPSSGRRPSP